MKRHNFPHIIRRQIIKEIKTKEAKPPHPIADIARNTITPDTSTDFSLMTSYQNIFPYLFSVLGKNRIIDGYRVIRLPSNQGMQVYIMPGYAYFDANILVENISGIIFEVPVYSDDQWVYLYLKRDGSIIANKYSPLVGENINYIPLAMIWIEAGSTEINPHFIVDIRLNRLTSLSELYGIRQQTAELYNAFPNTFVGQDKVLIQPVGGLNIRIIPNSSAMAYMQGHAIIVSESTITLTKPDQGQKEYWILGHAYIDQLELVYKMTYLQVEITQPIERYQIVVGKIKLSYDTEEITSDMIDQRMQRSCFNILEHSDKILWQVLGNVNLGQIELPKISDFIGVIKDVKVLIQNINYESGTTGNIIIDIKNNNQSIFDDDKIQIPLDSSNILLTYTNFNNNIYINKDDILTATIEYIPQGVIEINNLILQLNYNKYTIRPLI